MKTICFTLFGCIYWCTDVPVVCLPMRPGDVDESDLVINITNKSSNEKDIEARDAEFTFRPLDRRMLVRHPNRMAEKDNNPIIELLQENDLRWPKPNFHRNRLMKHYPELLEHKNKTYPEFKVNINIQNLNIPVTLHGIPFDLDATKNLTSAINATKILEKKSKSRHEDDEVPEMEQTFVGREFPDSNIRNQMENFVNQNGDSSDFGNQLIKMIASLTMLRDKLKLNVTTSELGDDFMKDANFTGCNINNISNYPESS